MTNMKNNESIVVPEMVNRLKQTDFDCIIYRGIVSDGSCLAIHDYSFRELMESPSHGGAVPMPSAWHITEWLRTHHGYHLSCTFDRNDGQWNWSIYRLWSLGHRKSDEKMLKKPILERTCNRGYDNWDEACRAGIEAAMERVKS